MLRSHLEDRYPQAAWRVGRKVGRTIYAQLGVRPADTDPLIGMMDTPELAHAAVAAHNTLTQHRADDPMTTPPSHKPANDDNDCFEAFVAGFLYSGEGINGEFHHYGAGEGDTPELRQWLRTIWDEHSQR